MSGTTEALARVKIDGDGPVPRPPHWSSPARS